MEFVLNAAHDTRIHNATFTIGGKKTLLFNYEKINQTLLQILSNCVVALNLRRYNDKHDLVLIKISMIIIHNLPEEFETNINIEGLTIASHSILKVLTKNWTQYLLLISVCLCKITPTVGNVLLTGLP